MCLSPPVCFEKPQTLQGKHKKGEEGKGVMRRCAEEPLWTHAATRPRCPKTQWVSSKRPQTAALSHSIACEEPWGLSGAHRWHPSVPSAETFSKGSFYGDNNTMSLIWHMTSVSFQNNIYVGFLLTTANLGNKITSVHLILNLRIKISVFIELWTQAKCGSC